MSLEVYGENSKIFALIRLNFKFYLSVKKI